MTAAAAGVGRLHVVVGVVVGSASGRHHVPGLVETVELSERLLQHVDGVGLGTLASRASRRHHLEEQA